MKKRSIISLIISFLILFSSLTVSAASFPPPNSQTWQNLSDKEADALFNAKNGSFIFFFYRDNCPNSAKAIPKCIEYARNHGLVLCGLNVNDYPNWSTWSNYLPAGQHSIVFPMIIAYNAHEDKVAVDDEVLSVQSFEKLLTSINMLSGASFSDLSEIQLFKDVSKNNKNYEAIKRLSQDGILSGYEDGTFKPDNSINRTEAAVVIVRAKGLKPDSMALSTYKDVTNIFWGKDYIMAASKAGIISGMGDGTFAPQNNVTKNQIIKMIVCMVGLEQSALQNGGWPGGYIKTAYENKIIDSATYENFNYFAFGNEAATRGDVAQWVYNSRFSNKGEGITVNGKEYELGMDASVLDKTNEIYTSINGFDWYVYGTDTYKNFFTAGVSNGKIVALASSGVGFEYKGYRAGDVLTGDDKNNKNFLTDKNDNNIVHGVFILDKKFTYTGAVSDKTLKNESIMNFHFTNGFRVYHKLTPYKWDETVSEAARLHSVDMATQNYFNHTALDGRSPGDRIKAIGLQWTAYAENIAAGLGLGVQSYDGWVNSSGHRLNLLGECTYLGVGKAYNKDSTYGFYATQNFYSYERISAFDTFIGFD